MIEYDNFRFLCIFFSLSLFIFSSCFCVILYDEIRKAQQKQKLNLYFLFTVKSLNTFNTRAQMRSGDGGGGDGGCDGSGEHGGLLSLTNDNYLLSFLGNLILLTTKDVVNLRHIGTKFVGRFSTWTEWKINTPQSYFTALTVFVECWSKNFRSNLTRILSINDCMCTFERIRCWNTRNRENEFNIKMFYHSVGSG